MSIEHRLAEAVRAKTEAARVPSVDVTALREQGRRQSRRRRGIAVASAAAVIATIGGVALLQRTEPPMESPIGSEGADRVARQGGVRAFLDPNAGVLHLGDRTIALAEVPGLADSGLAVRGGVLYQTPDQEVRLIDASGHQTVLAGALGPPPAGFTPSVAYDAETDVAVALRLTDDSLVSGRPLIAAYAASTGELLVSANMIQMADATAVTLAGATDGVAAVNYQSATWTEILDWTWITHPRGSEWRLGRAIDLHNKVVLMDGGTSRPGIDPRLHAGEWDYVDGRPGERLDPTGSWRVDSTWQPWPSGGPVERSTSDDGTSALPQLPPGSRLSLSYDTDGSVLAAVAEIAGSEDAVLVYDCNLDAQVCEPIGRIEGDTTDPLFLHGAKP